MPRGFSILSAIPFLLALTAPAALATQMEHLDTRALVIGSNDIVVGQIESVQSHWSPSHSKIFTDVRVTESLKGAATDRITLTQLGGQVGDMRYTVPGCPVFKPGEEALLFVWRDARGGAQVNGLAQGKFDIERDAATGVATVQRSVPGLAFREARTLQLVPAGQRAPRIPLNDLRQEILRVLGEGGR
jgi:hypothetical protein